MILLLSDVSTGYTARLQRKGGGRWSFSLPLLSVILLKTKGKEENPPRIHMWPHLPMSACLLAHRCILKMGLITFVSIILVPSCMPTSIHLWLKPQRVQNTVHGVKDNSLRNNSLRNNSLAHLLSLNSH